MIGRTISQYQILEKLGGGGMGVVYKAHDTRLDRPVALKFLPPHLSKDPDANQRFTREAKAASALDHPNICTIYDIGEDDDGQLFIVMAYYEGQTLKYRLADGLSTEESVEIAIQMAEGLERAHEAGIVHRDVKPANLMVTDRGRVKILDFGVAKLGGSAALTQAGSTLGTVSYMSPEQTHGEEVDARTDLWALGVVLYEMLTGQRPFRGDYDQAVVYSILNEEPEPLRAVNPEVPAGLARVVEKLLMKDPTKRYQRVEDLLPDLKALRVAETDSMSVGAMEATPAGRSMGRWMMIAVPVVLLLLGGLWALSRWGSASPEPATPAARAAIVVLPFAVRGETADLNDLLSEGMVDLLSTRIDGTGELRAVDPNAVLGYLKRNPVPALDPQSGQEVADHFEANTFILGTVNKTGEQFQFTASLYDAGAALITREEVVAEGEDQLLTTVDDLARHLITNQLKTPGDQLKSLAAMTTSDFTALRAYLEGLQALRGGRFQEADEAGHRAVEADSTFALAWYLLTRAHSWSGGREVEGGTTVEAILQQHQEEVDTALVRVQQYQDALPERIKALRDTRPHAKTDEAERRFQALLATYPDDIDIMGVFGDMLYHYNPLRGRPATEALPYFRRVLFYDPDNLEYFGHMAQLAVQEHDYAAFDSLILQADLQDLTRLFCRALQQRLRGTPEDADALLALTRSASLGVFLDVVVTLMSMNRIADAQQVAEAFAEATTLPDGKFFGPILADVMAGTRGQWHRGLDATTALAPISPGGTLAGEVFLHLLPYAPNDPAALDTLERRVARWDTTAALMKTLGGLILHEGDYANLQAYLLGLLCWRQGDLAGTQHYADELRRRANPEADNNLAYSFSRTLDGLIHWHEEDLDEALTALEDARLQPGWVSAERSVFLFQRLDRYTRAEILYAQGRYEEALRWYKSLHDGLTLTGQGLWYLGPSYLRHAEIYEHLGEPDKAIDYYTRFLDLWQDADTDLQSEWVEPARQRLERLLGDTVREPGDMTQPGEGS